MTNADCEDGYKFTFFDKTQHKCIENVAAEKKCEWRCTDLQFCTARASPTKLELKKIRETEILTTDRLSGCLENVLYL
ncbi:MAG: wyosine [tRNA(Phe)-imidazoG37] synthetase (radical SAM superfamily) [Bacillariaceae sp.]|jgi:wyosine [tRNA(Phe)-imidazoG37] synthetase (radical SAM superfamily)